MLGTPQDEITWETLAWTGICRETAARIAEVYQVSYSDIVPLMIVNEPRGGWSMFED